MNLLYRKVSHVDEPSVSEVSQETESMHTAPTPEGLVHHISKLSPPTSLVEHNIDNCMFNLPVLLANAITLEGYLHLTIIHVIIGTPHCEDAQEKVEIKVFSLGKCCIS